MPTRRREPATAATLVVASLIGGFLLLELACRLIAVGHRLLDPPTDASGLYHWIIPDPLLGFVYKPDSVAPDATFDRDGFRTTPAGASGKGGPLVATGDSFTFGLEVADSEAWPAVLQQLTGIRVVNAGVGAYGIDQTVLRTELLTAALAPRAVIVSFIADDLWRAEMRRLWGAEKPYFALTGDDALVLHNVNGAPTAPIARLRQLLGWSALAEFVVRRLTPYGDWAHWHAELFGDVVRVLPPGSGGKVACALMGRLAVLGVPVLVVAQYEPAFWTRGPVFRARQRQQSRGVLDCAATAGLATLDTADMLDVAVRRDGLSSLYLQEHHSALGNRRVAEAIADALASRGMLGPAMETTRPDPGGGRR